MNHTPGPWNTFGPLQTGFSSQYYCVGNKEKQVCQTGGDMEMKIPNNLEEQLANARLISAAPDLLEACKYAIGCINGTVRDYADELPEKLRAAIDKAEGK